MIISITLSGDKEMVARLDKMPTAVHLALKMKIVALALKLEKWVKTQKLNGQVLNRISGRLARSIGNKVDDTIHLIMASVFSSGDVKYAAIHEYGGRTAPHLIVPKKAKALFFGGKFASVVHHPGSKMPERSFLRSSLTDLSSQISLGMKEAVIKAVQKSVDG